MGNTFEKLKCGRRDHSFFVYIFSCRSTCGSHTSALDVALRNTEAWFVAGWTVLNMKGGNNMQWIFIRRTDAEAETPILWPADLKNWLTGKDSDAGKDWRQEEKVTTEDEVVGWHHRLYEHEFEQSPGVGEGQGSLASCCPRGHRELDTSEWLNSELNAI